MLHDDTIVTHLIMENIHKKQCPYIRGEGFGYARQSQVSKPKTISIHIPSKAKMSYPKIYQANQMHTKSSQWKILYISAIILNNV